MPRSKRPLLSRLLLALTAVLLTAAVGCSTSKSENAVEAPAAEGPGAPADAPAPAPEPPEEEAPTRESRTSGGSDDNDKVSEDPTPTNEEAADEEAYGGGEAIKDAEVAPTETEKKEDAKPQAGGAMDTGGIEASDSSTKSRKRSAPAKKGSTECPPDDKDCEEDPGFLRKRPSK